MCGVCLMSYDLCIIRVCALDPRHPTSFLLPKCNMSALNGCYKLDQVDCITRALFDGNIWNKF